MNPARPHKSRAPVNVDQLRKLRARAEVLLRNVVPDLRSFVNADGVTFRTTPELPFNRKDISVTTTGSCLMALTLTGNLQRFYKRKDDTEDNAWARVRDALDAMVEAKWQSSGLAENNAFTTCLVLRTAGFLSQQEKAGIKVGEYKKDGWHLAARTKPKNKPKGRTLNLSSIARAMVEKIERFSINQYPTSAAVVYWFIDGVDRGKVALPEATWDLLCDWAREEFQRQRSLVLARHDAMMDPVAMGMAACLCARLRTISERPAEPADKYRDKLPSRAELEHSIRELFNHQTHSGIWPKYFPLFHYQEAGSNFCFTFEMLEALLYEFGRPEYGLLDQPLFIEGLEIATAWCEKNRLQASQASRLYTGWNSGGFFKTLRKGQPESWPTAVVYMFLEELKRVVSARIQRRLLDKYGAYQPLSGSDRNKFDRLLDIDVLVPPLISSAAKKTTLKTILEQEFIDTHRDRDETAVRLKQLKRPLSALLFGPPGTSKTAVVEALADVLGWPLITINPSEFVKGSLDNVYLQSEEIFQDLMDLAGVVVFFDEMDALTQSREERELDTFTLFLTTSMLPKLTKLHDGARVMFFMATNYQERFDEAIKRAGRFDFLICMGPPPLKNKVRGFAQFFGDDLPKDAAKKAQKRLEKLVDSAVDQQDSLELFTYGDFKAFLRDIGDEKSILSNLQRMTKTEFIRRIESFKSNLGLRMQDVGRLAKTIKELDKKPIAELERVSDTKIGRYFIDRRESRRQY